MHPHITRKTLFHLIRPRKAEAIGRRDLHRQNLRRDLPWQECLPGRLQLDEITPESSFGGFIYKLFTFSTTPKQIKIMPVIIGYFFILDEKNKLRVFPQYVRHQIS